MPHAARGIAIFALTYLLISGWKIRWFPANRPAGALLGAVLMVACGVLTPAQAYGSVNFDTLVLLLGTMILSEFLKLAGFYPWVAARIGGAGLSPRACLRSLVFLSGGMSALLVNDTVCLMLTPLVVAIVEAAALPVVPFLMALATSANIGSALTLTGNPQNMIVGTLSGIPYLRFAAASAAPVVVSLLANDLLLARFYGRELAAARAAPVLRAAPEVDRPLLWKSWGCLGLAILGFALSDATGLGLAWTAVAAASLLLAIGKRDPYVVFAGIDWPLLLFFSGLFVVIGGLAQTGVLHDVEEGFVRPALGDGVMRQSLVLTGLTVAGSQLFSNVPYVLATGHWIPGLADPELGWVLLAFVSTVAGNLTILGSVANVIVLEQARRHATIGFFQYLRFGILTTLASTVLGVALLLLEHRLGWI